MQVMGSEGIAPLSEEEIGTLAEGGVVIRDRVVDEVLTSSWRETLATWATSGRMTVAGVGKGHNVRRRVRSDLACWVEATDLPGAHALFDRIRHEVVRGTWVGLDGFELQAACYPGAGARYVRHLDTFRGDPRRRFTAILYLNPGWARAHGGQLIAWTPTGLRKVAPLAGRLVLFRSELLPHAVSASRAPRFALTAWMRGPG